MPRIYDNNFKFMIVDLIVNKKNSTSKTAEKYGVPLKTLEKWITSYNKDKTSFGTENLTKEEQIKELKTTQNNYHKIDIFLKNEYHLNAYLDSGNKTKSIYKF